MTTKIVASPKRKMHPNSLANLKPPYKPGENGNPKPGNSLKAALLNALGEPLKEPKANAPARDHVIYATLKGAIACEPSSTHLKEVWDRNEGKVADKTDHTFNGEGLSEILSKLRGYNPPELPEGE